MHADLFHVGLTVANLDCSVGFYRDVVGMDVLSVVDLDSDAFRRLTHNPRARLRTALLGAGGCQLQLVEYTAGGGVPLDIDHRHAGAPHLSVWVVELDALYDRLSEDEDVTMTSERVEVIPGVRPSTSSIPMGAGGVHRTHPRGVDHEGR